MLIKYAARSFIRYLLQNMLTVLQLSSVFIITAFMLSSLSLRLSRYLPFHEEFEGSGRLAVFSSFAYSGKLTGEYSMINSSNDFKQMLGFDVTSLGIHFCDAYIKGGENEFIVRSADSELLKRYEPALKEGEWLSKKSLCAAVSANSGYSVGDRLTLFYCTSDGQEKELEITVACVIKENEKLAGLTGENDGQQANTFELFFKSAESDDSKKLILLDESLLPDDMARAYTGTVVLSYKEASDESRITKLLSDSGCIYSISMNTVRSESRKYLYIHTYELLPLMIIILIMALTSSISTSALSTRQQLNDHSIFILCGMRKEKCMIFSLIESIICLFLAFVIFLLLSSLITYFSPDRFYLCFDLFTFLGIFIISLIFISFSLTVPFLMISKTDIKTMLMCT